MVCTEQDDGREGSMESSSKESENGVSMPSPSHWPWLLPSELHSFHCLPQRYILCILTTSHVLIVASCTDLQLQFAGAQALFMEGMLATVDVNKAAEAHVCVYEAMGSGAAFGRYLCFDHVIRRVEEVAELERQLRAPGRISSTASDVGADQPSWCELSRGKLSRLMSSMRRCTYDSYFV